MTAISYIDGAWVEGNPPVMGPMSHAAWLASVVFDGARYFAGAAPDLDRHCARLVRSALALGLEPPVDAKEIERLAWEGIGRFPPDAELYIRPLVFAENGFLVPDPRSARFVLTLFDEPLPEPRGWSACLSRTRRPAPDMAPTDAKASCLYPNVARALREAREKGFDNAVVLDPAGHVAEFASANLFLATRGVTVTPVPNGTFLNGITRQRVIALLREAGREVVERTVEFREVLEADEVFATSNYVKVVPVTRIEVRDMRPGPVYRKARELYLAFARRSARRA